MPLTIDYAVVHELDASGRIAAGREYATEAEAKTNCRADTVVWVNSTSKVYHGSASRSYGKTKTGAYMCEKESAAAGFRAAKTARGAAT